MYSPSLMQLERFYEVICCVCKNICNVDIMYTALFLYFFKTLISKCYKSITTRSSSGKP